MVDIVEKADGESRNKDERRKTRCLRLFLPLPGGLLVSRHVGSVRVKRKAQISKGDVLQVKRDSFTLLCRSKSMKSNLQSVSQAGTSTTKFILTASFLPYP